ncbi:hypothetical protein [Amycolatopsis benzoatilytica]|uniref:hypothetical protein n=1 Tax=Amycolatopsis benzoatilytica TaxID=346045 RepID=UPI0012B6A231|nr:hypothetical protein [Amycolatopsis benzoatilytica]
MHDAPTDPDRPTVVLLSPEAGSPEEGPVFVDGSGQRRSRVRRFGWFLAAPALAYLVLLVSTLLGGPGLPRAILPLPDSALPGNHAAPEQTEAPGSTAPTSSPAVHSRAPEASRTTRPAAVGTTPAGAPALTTAPAPPSTAPSASAPGRNPTFTPPGQTKRATPTKKA